MISPAFCDRGQKTSTPLSGVLILAGLLLFAAQAQAQIVTPDESALARTGVFSRDANISVRQRPKPEYAPVDIHLGAFSLTPSLDSGIEYNDNIYAVPTGQIAGTIAHIAPGVAVQSQWSRNQFTAYARGAFNEYLRQTSENTSTFAAGAGGRIDISRNSGLALGVAYGRDTEARTAPNSPVLAKHPINFDTADLFIGGAYDFNHLRLSSRIEFQDLSYANGQTPLGGILFEKDRDHSTVTETLRAEYGISPATSLFGNVVLNQQAFRNQLPRDVSRSSTGYDATFGVNFDLSHLARGEIDVGYLAQNYQKSLYKPQAGVSVHGVIEYFLTQITTITLTTSRSALYSTIPGAGGYLDTTVALQVDHELRRNWIVTASASFENDGYNGVSRNDRRYSQTIGASYLVNRATSLNLTVSHMDNVSTGSAHGFSFNDNRIAATIGLHF